MWNNVDFPEPDGPTMDTNSPAWTSRSTPRKACTSTSPARYVLRRPRIHMIGWSLIRERFDGVLARGLQAGIDCAEHGTHQREASRDEPPDVHDVLDQRALDEVANGEPRTIPQ